MVKVFLGLGGLFGLSFGVVVGGVVVGGGRGELLGDWVVG